MPRRASAKPKRKATDAVVSPTVKKPTDGNESSSQIQQNTRINLQKNEFVNFDLLHPGVELLFHTGNLYRCEQLLLTGKFGRIWTAKSVNTDKETKALRMFNKKGSVRCKKEFDVLKLLRNIPEKDLFLTCEVEIMEGFCAVMERFSMVLSEFIKKKNQQNEVVPMSMVRPIAQQTLLALKKLHSMGIIHGNLNCECIAIMDSESRPLRVKLMDFTHSPTQGPNGEGTIWTPLNRIAPENILGFPQRESADVWALGCTLARLRLHRELFPANSLFDALRFITGTLGNLLDYMITNKSENLTYYCQDEDGEIRLKTVTEYVNSNFPASDINTDYEIIPDIHVALEKHRESDEIFCIEDADNLTGLILELAEPQPENRSGIENALNSSFLQLSSFTPCDGLTEYIAYNKSFM